MILLTPPLTPTPNQSVIKVPSNFRYILLIKYPRYPPLLRFLLCWVLDRSQRSDREGDSLYLVVGSWSEVVRVDSHITVIFCIRFQFRSKALPTCLMKKQSVRRFRFLFCWYYFKHFPWRWIVRFTNIFRLGSYKPIVEVLLKIMNSDLRDLSTDKIFCTGKSNFQSFLVELVMLYWLCIHQHLLAIARASVLDLRNWSTM